MEVTERGGVYALRWARLYGSYGNCLVIIIKRVLGGSVEVESLNRIQQLSVV